MWDLIVRNALLRNRSKTVDIFVSNGMISSLEPSARGDAKEEIDAAGRLVCPPFIDSHVHLDAVLSVGNPRYNESGSHLEGIEVWDEYRKTLTRETIRENALRAILWEAVNGVQWIRTHVDVSDGELKTLQAILEVREAVRDIVDIQIVAFPQDGIYTSRRGEELMRESVTLGVDAVGGIPHCELTREDGVKDVQFAFDLAEKNGLMVDIHCDETGDEESRFIETMAACSIRHGMEGMAAASHATAMHNYNNDYAVKLMGVLRQADLAVITNPFDNSVLQNRFDGYPRRRGHTRVDELLSAGITVAIGHDSIMDPWYPLGKGSMIMAANLLLHTAQLSGKDQVPLLFDMITFNPAQILGIKESYGIEAGKPASFIVLDSVSELQALRLMPEVLCSVRKGKIISRAESAKRRIIREKGEELIDFTIPGRDA